MSNINSEFENTSGLASIGPLHRFRLMQGHVTREGRLEKSNSVGMAFLKEGRNLYVLRLNTFIDARFYLAPSRDKPSRYLLMTRERSSNPRSRRKYFWNFIGNGTVDASIGVIRIKFDLFEETIYMSLFPEPDAPEVKDAKAAKYEETAPGEADFDAAA
ncbi:MAG TPA: hypothetical protein DCS07_13750 [Bdellovibrionales bacterium]|nr:MAG: hypothetical protein A2Z97_03585 [Bdellovibrionales bacterium GWB1_52_6]OFZ04023.1 MAG: hypothetical protein A2X97_14565 [Bdellovibrionales bacterium GWA1_52_35]OFZ39769.1 MAG: hypothetical protein A2070_01110 [Bdellovibrionales bacterium GWC1_52_8]HAR43673.1 hypothetical protein [Bdellovibrionales bacterium]HCM39892.1 hypothetical protein [Bdellovibrionales bacterium]